MMTSSANSFASKTDQIGARHYAGIFLLSIATLLLELSLTRVLSVAMFYHFGFLVISTALLGFAVSGVVLARGANCENGFHWIERWYGFPLSLLRSPSLAFG
jgi:hypothetical protein